MSNRLCGFLVPRLGFAAVLAAALVVGVAAPASADNARPLPRFTEEREAAALFFVKKHVPEVLPLLEQLKKSNPAQYEQEIREVFQVTEMLAELQDDPRRHDLELKVWKTENKAYALVARLSTPNEEERKKIEAELHDLARELVELDVQVLELKADQLDKELGEVKDELAKAREQTDKQAKTRYEGLVDQAKKRKKM
jgi:hypothetical protein